MKTLDSLGALFADVRDGVLRMGRAGGGVLVAVAAGLGGVAGWLFWLADDRASRGALYRYSEIRGFGVGLVVLAVVVAFLGVAQIVRPRAPRDRVLAPMEPKELLELARATLRPFYVCVRCRRVWGRSESVGRCPQCDSVADCLEVKTDADLKMVEAAIDG
ncbi:MAG: hypothetical protein QM765_38220 [Myxococcales bacterium]